MEDELLTKIKAMGFNNPEDFIRKHFHLLDDSQKKLVKLIGISEDTPC